MVFSRCNSSDDHCPQCRSRLNLEEIILKEGTVPNPIVCPECGRELVLRSKYHKSSVLIWYAFGFLIAGSQKLEFPVFLLVFPVYGFLILLVLLRYVLPHLPSELRVKHQHLQGLGLGCPSPKHHAIAE